MPLFQVDSVSQDNCAIECEPRFRAVPIDKLVDRMVIRSLTTFRSQCVSTADFVCSRSGWARDRFGGFLFLRLLGILGGLLRRFPSECLETPYLAVSRDLCGCSQHRSILNAREIDRSRMLESHGTSKENRAKKAVVRKKPLWKHSSCLALFLRRYEKLHG
jgi:hypothetical protein